MVKVERSVFVSEVGCNVDLVAGTARREDFAARFLLPCNGQHTWARCLNFRDYIALERILAEHVGLTGSEKIVVDELSYVNFFFKVENLKWLTVSEVVKSQARSSTCCNPFVVDAC